MRYGLSEIKSKLTSSLKEAANPDYLVDTFITYKAQELFEKMKFQELTEKILSLDSLVEELKIVGFDDDKIEFVKKDFVSIYTDCGRFDIKKCAPSNYYIVFPSKYFVTDSKISNSNWYQSLFISQYRPSDIAQYMLSVVDSIEKWRNEDWNEFVLKYQKQNKQIQMTLVSADAVVRSQLKGTGIGYFIEEQKIRLKIIFLISEKYQISFTINVKNFAERIGKIINTVKDFKTMVDGIDIPYSINTVNNWITWIYPEK